MTRPVVMRVQVTIKQTEAGWDVYLPTYDPWHAESGMQALNKAMAWAKELPHSSVMEITWEPTTSLGRSVVKVLTE